MTSLNINTFLIGALLVLPLTANAETPTTDLQEARILVKAFGGELKSTLQTAMAIGGPSKALEACHLKAGPIAEKISSSSGWRIARTSLKVRNIGNKPDKWESMTLLQFEKRKAAGEDLNKMEYAEVVKQGDNSVFRYMKPIPTNELCITCHGNNLNEELSKKLKLLYPYDKATGFKVGDIRGAFTLQKNLN